MNTKTTPTRHQLAINMERAGAAMASTLSVECARTVSPLTAGAIQHFDHLRRAWDLAHGRWQQAGYLTGEVAGNAAEVRNAALEEGAKLADEMSSHGAFIADHIRALKTAQPAQQAGESIDTPEFRALEFAYVQALIHGDDPKGAWATLIAHIDSCASLAASAAMPVPDDSVPPESFISYVRANYNGVIDIHRPEWHAARLWKAAQAARFSSPAAPAVPTPEHVAYFWRASESDAWLECPSGEPGAVRFTSAAAPTGEQQ